MKTIQQRLQSRISRRRNVIRECEEEVSMLVQQRRWLREEGTGEEGADVRDFRYLNAEVREAKQFIASMADNQKLDKQLAGIVLGLSQTRRHYGLSDY